ncbi:MAG: hypothetical protein ACR652_01045 [Methylocystis sp.]|uniref:hypothetical protein n=1 Tax=Methylocystis sp. TaxID=1911079 RepID=UPI003DA61CB1
MSTVNPTRPLTRANTDPDIYRKPTEGKPWTAPFLEEALRDALKGMREEFTGSPCGKTPDPVPFPSRALKSWRVSPAGPQQSHIAGKILNLWSPYFNVTFSKASAGVLSKDDVHKFGKLALGTLNGVLRVSELQPEDLGERARKLIEDTVNCDDLVVESKLERVNMVVGSLRPRGDVET